MSQATDQEYSEENKGSDEFNSGACAPQQWEEKVFWDAELKSIKTKVIPDVKVRSDCSEPSITGLCFTNDDQIIICDNANCKIKVVDEDYAKIKYEEMCESPPFDVAIVDDNKVIVSLPSSESLQYVTVKPGFKFDEKIDAEGKCFGVETYQEQIFVCIGKLSEISDPSTSICQTSFCGIKILSLKGEVIRSVPCRGVGSPYYFCLGREGTNIYITGGTGETASLSCVTKDGFGVFKFTEEILQDPRSVVVDKEGNVIVMDSLTNKLYAIKSTGSQSQCLLHKKNKPYDLTALCYNSRSGVLVVACKCGLLAKEPEKVKSRLMLYKLEARTMGYRKRLISSIVKKVR